MNKPCEICDALRADLENLKAQIAERGRAGPGYHLSPPPNEKLMNENAELRAEVERLSKALNEICDELRYSACEVCSQYAVGLAVDAMEGKG